MRRQDALSEAHKFLKTRQGEWIKQRVEKNQQLSHMRVAHAVADVIQRGQNPKDIDFQKIDWGVSYANIRGQIKDLLEQKQGQEAEFEQETDARRESQVAKWEKEQRYRKSDRLKQKAEFVHQGQPRWSRYVDKTRDAEKKFEEPITEEEYTKWARNRTEADIEGIDDKQPKEQRPEIHNYPFQKSIAQKKKEMLMKNTGANGGRESPDQFKDLKSKQEALRFRSSEKHSSSRNNNSKGLNSKLDELMGLKSYYDSRNKRMSSRKKKLASKKEPSSSSKLRKVAEQKKDQGWEEFNQTRTETAVNQNALIPNFDIPDVVEEDPYHKNNTNSSSKSGGSYMERKKEDFF